MSATVLLEPSYDDYHSHAQLTGLGWFARLADHIQPLLRDSEGANELARRTAVLDMY